MRPVIPQRKGLHVTARGGAKPPRVVASSPCGVTGGYNEGHM